MLKLFYVFLALCQTKPSWRLNKISLWAKGVEWVKVLNALRPLCLWQCLLKMYMWIFTNNHINFNSNCSSMNQAAEVDEYQVIIGGNCCWTSLKAMRDSWLGYNDFASDFSLVIFLDCISGQSAEKESNLRFPFYSRPPMKELCNQFIQSKALITNFSFTTKMI